MEYTRPASSVNPQEQDGIAIVGTRLTFRHRGLGRAMVLARMGNLKEHGADTATLGISGSNTEAIQESP